MKAVDPLVEEKKRLQEEEKRLRKAKENTRRNERKCELRKEKEVVNQNTVVDMSVRRHKRGLQLPSS